MISSTTIHYITLNVNCIQDLEIKKLTRLKINIYIYIILKRFSVIELILFIHISCNVSKVVQVKLLLMHR